MKNKTIYTICSLFTLLVLLGTSQNLLAQNITATGKVVDRNQEPLIGANVKVTGTQGGTITGLDGDFTLSCPQGSTLEISFIGFITQQVPAGRNLTITMQEDAIALEETVIVGIGYGTMRKGDLTGSIASVSAKDMKQGVITSAEQLLQGKVAGLSVVQSSGAPEAGASIRLRGGTSLSASNGPLIVVDGIPGVDMNSVQPTEILSIDVLKDASAAAIYGSRGANGVIIVTTNRTSTDTEQKSIQYNGYVAIGQTAKHMDLLSANQWRAYVRDNNIGSAIDYGYDTDWQDELERTAISHSHNVSISNSKKESGYRASITYQDNQGVIKRNDMNRLAGSTDAGNFRTGECQNRGRKRGTKECLLCLCQPGDAVLQSDAEYAESISGGRHHLLHGSGHYEFCHEPGTGSDERREMDQCDPRTDQCDPYRSEYLSYDCKIRWCGRTGSYYRICKWRGSTGDRV